MNEPAYVSPSAWQTDAQSAVNAIGQSNTKTALYVEGDDWSVASTWQLPWYSGSLSVTDPDNNLYYEAHQYADPVNTVLYYYSFNSNIDYTTWILICCNPGSSGSLDIAPKGCLVNLACR